MLKYRLISFPLLLALLALIFFAPSDEVRQILFSAAAPLAVGLALYEAGKLLLNIKLPCYPVFCGIAGGGYALFFCLMRMFFFDVSFSLAALGVAMLALPWIFILYKEEKKFRRLVGSFGVILSLGIPLVLVLNLYYYDFHGVSLLLYVILVTKSMDTGGYIFGMLSAKLLPGGNHKIAPRLSPKKSWEGAVGGLLLCLAVSYIFYKCNGGDIIKYAVSAVILGVCSFFGDITESGLKRVCGVKDSGNWIPGMGGAFDVLDSFIYVGIVCTILLIYPGI